MNDEIDPLTAAAAAATASNDAGGGSNSNDDASSVSSQRSAGGRSLLERIQMQREREAAAASAAASTSDYKAMMTSTTPQQIQIPNYGQSMPGFGSSSNIGVGNQNGASSPANDGGVSTNFLSSTWSNLSQSAAGDSSFSMSPMPDATPHSLEDGMNDALLPPSSAGGMPRHDEDYSMSDYFMTFVKDVTGLFSRLHIVPRIILFVALLYVAIKLL
jgi:hypothetical protein